MHDWIFPDWPAPPRVKALITTRRGGFSAGECYSFNLAQHVGDDPRHVAMNRARLRALLPAEPAWLNQVHGIAVARADDGLPLAAADAAYTREPQTVCAVMTADCLPVLLCDDAGTVVAAVHAGWRGLAAGVIEAAVARMVPARPLLAYLGPAIGPASFEVGGEVREAFLHHDGQAVAAFAPAGKGKWFADLYLLARQRLEEAGVRNNNVYGGGFDTFADSERFFSFRRSRHAGRMAALIWIGGEAADSTIAARTVAK